MKRFGRYNRLMCADSYKASQSKTYPDGTEFVYSYIESRGGEYDKTLWFGLQYILKEYFSDPITVEEVEEAAEMWALHGEPFDKELWLRVVDECDGRLPLEIRAIPEGTVIETKNVLCTVENTIPNFGGIVSFFETVLMQVWFPTTVATNSYRIKQILKKAFDETSDDASGIDFKLHDFGFRGTSSQESAGIGGLAHLLNFKGTDTMIANMFGREYYNEPMAGFSIPAGEHSCVTSYGRGGEETYWKKMLSLFGKPGALWACPIDSYNTWDFIDKVVQPNLEALKASGSTYVARPDSGDPLTTPIKVIERLDNCSEGSTRNSKGYWVLPSYLRVIQGDGIDIKSLPRIVDNLKTSGYSIDNLAFGMGGGLLQQVNRDTYKFAMKCSAIRVDGKWRDVFKDPVDQPDKKSKKGRFYVRLTPEGSYVTENAVGFDIVSPDNQLRKIWENGELLIDDDLATIRARVA